MINNNDDSLLNLQTAKDNYLSKDYQKALLYIIKYLKLYPNNFEGLLLKSKIYSCLKNFPSSIQTFEKCLRLNSKCIEAIYGQAKCLKELRFYKEAIEKYRNIIELEPTPKIYNSIGACLYCMGHKEEAICQYNIAIQLDQNYTPAYFNKGICLSNLDKKEEAISQYNKAIELNNNYVDAYFQEVIVIIL